MGEIPVFGREDHVPSSLSGLNLVDVMRYEDERLGAEFRYGFPPICKADAYLYNLGFTDIPNDLNATPVAEAFKQSFEGVLESARYGAIRDLEVLGTSILTLPGEETTPFCYYASFGYSQNAQAPGVQSPLIAPGDRGEFVVSDIGRMRSYLAVRSDRGFINKVRFSYVERALEPSNLGVNPEEFPQTLRDEAAFAGFWNFLMAWTRAVQSAPIPRAGEAPGEQSASEPHLFAPGSAQAPTSREAPHPWGPIPVPGSEASAMDMPHGAVCQACRRGPAAPLKVVKQTGMVFTRRSESVDANLCQSCGISLFRQAQAHNLALGWWGLIAIFSNILALGGNFTRSRKHRAIGPPNGVPLAVGLDPGRPVWLRIHTIVPVALIALVGIGIVVSMSHERVGALRAGQCIDIPSAGSFTDVALVPCDEPHDAEVAGVLPASTSSSVDINEACIRIAAERVLLSKARSVSPGILERSTTPEPNRKSKPTASGPETPRAICILAGVDGEKLTGRVTGGE